MVPPLQRFILRWKICSIKRDIRRIVSRVCHEKFWIDWYGAFYIDPKHLVFWVCVQTDQMKGQLEADDNLLPQLRDLLSVHNYPKRARNHVWIGFESQETVDRESDGNWFFHFK